MYNLLLRIPPAFAALYGAMITATTFSVMTGYWWPIGQGLFLGGVVTWYLHRHLKEVYNDDALEALDARLAEYAQR